MPQISQLAATYASQIFWLIVTFGLVFLVVGRGMLPRVQRTIETRDGRIAGDLAAAKAARDAADRAEAEWQARDQVNRERAQAVVAEARAKAARASEATLSEDRLAVPAIPTRGSPACFSGFEYDDVLSLGSRVACKEVGAEGACDAGSDDDYVRFGGEVGRSAVAE